MAQLLLRNLGAKFSETSSLIFKTYFTQIGRCYIFTQKFKMFDSNKKKSCVYFSTFPYILFHFPCENQIGSQ